MADASARSTLSLSRPLRTPIFRNLLVADVVSDVGMFMHSVSTAWRMIFLHAGPISGSSDPDNVRLSLFIFALPAGAIADIVDRRMLILYTESLPKCS